MEGPASVPKDTMDYYRRLDVGGDLLKAMAAGHFEKAARKYAALLKAREEPARLEAKRLA